MLAEYLSDFLFEVTISFEPGAMNCEPLGVQLVAFLFNTDQGWLRKRGEKIPLSGYCAICMLLLAGCGLDVGFPIHRRFNTFY